MKRLLSLAALLLIAPAAFAFPSAAGFVNDYAGVLSNVERSALESQLTNIEKSTSNQVSVVIVTSFEGRDPFTYSQEIFTQWHIGDKTRNNGILIVIGPKEGRPFPAQGEIFINVGKGLEGALPDSLTGTIIRQEMVPSFKQRKLFEGIQNGILAIDAATHGEYTPITKKSGNGSLPVELLLWLGFIVVSYLGSFLARSKSWWLGGVVGTGAGALVGVLFFTGTLIVFSSVGLGLLGLLFDWIVSRNYEYRKTHGLPTDFRHSGGGFWFGGGRGGFGGGGFGGFGGGSSGGGGAGGSW